MFMSTVPPSTTASAMSQESVAAAAQQSKQDHANERGLFFLFFVTFNSASYAARSYSERVLYQVLL